MADGTVAGNIASWEQDGQRLLGYWVGREHWGRGVATQALAQFARQVTARPLYAHVAVHNAGSVRVLEKCAFQRDRAQEATGRRHLTTASKSSSSCSTRRPGQDGVMTRQWPMHGPEPTR